MQRSAYAPAAVLPDYAGGAEHASVTEAIRNATLVVVSCRPGVFDLDAVKETIEIAREARKPYAVIVNATPPKRQDALAALNIPGLGRADYAALEFLAGVGRRRGRHGVRRRVLCRGQNGPALRGYRKVGEANPRREACAPAALVAGIYALG
jgi:sugar/nucleoside kinase (ribokinase family)